MRALPRIKRILPVVASLLSLGVFVATPFTLADHIHITDEYSEHCVVCLHASSLLATDDACHSYATRLSVLGRLSPNADHPATVESANLHGVRAPPLA